VKAYEGLEFWPGGPDSRLEPVDFRHFLIFGGDSNIEVITPNEPTVQRIDEKTELHFRFEV
jgi:hypothetical protein